MIKVWVFWGALFVCSVASANVEVSELDLKSPQHNRPLKIRVWYVPGAACDAHICLSDKQDLGRIALVSHGAFGSPRSLNWLGSGLAARGWVVVGLAHYGESWVYGRETIDPLAAMKYWQRGQDFSVVLDAISGSPLFSKPLTTDNVLGIGHSAGGFTVLSKLGAEFDWRRAQKYCSSAASEHDKSCAYSRELNSAMEKGLLGSGAHQGISQYDARVTRAVVLDPALGHGAVAKSVSDIAVPTLVVSSRQNDFLRAEVHGEFYAGLIPRVTEEVLDNGEGHFIYLDRCGLDIKAVGVSICEDRDEVDRARVHRHLLTTIDRFLAGNPVPLPEKTD